MKIIIEVSGGLVQNVAANAAGEVEIRDYDIEGGDLGDRKSFPTDEDGLQYERAVWRFGPGGEGLPVE